MDNRQKTEMVLASSPEFVDEEWSVSAGGLRSEPVGSKERAVALAVECMDEWRVGVVHITQTTKRGWRIVMKRDRLIAELTRSTTYLLDVIEEMLESHADLVPDQRTVLKATRLVRQDLKNAKKEVEVYWDTNEDDQCTGTANAFEKLLAAAKEAVVEITYCGTNDKGDDLWQVLMDGQRLLALQGTRVQVIKSLLEERFCV